MLKSRSEATGLASNIVAPPSALRARGSSLDLRADPIELTAALVDIPSESRHERLIADEVEAALHAQASGYEVIRNGDAVLARTNLGKPTRVLLAGHLDTVPAADNVPSRRVGDELFGCGTSDMKSGDAVFLHLAATVANPSHDVTLVMYDCEEIESSANGLGRIERELPDWLRADVAILGEPSGGFIEAGCQGTIRVVVRASGTRAHSARSWLGDNAIHKLGAVLDRLSSYVARSVEIDGCTYREGLSAVRIEGGIAGNVIPDAASVTVNFRFAPDRSVEQAEAHVREVLDGLDVEIERTDAAAGALPGLTEPAAAALVRAAGGQVRAKFGWTDVARFAALGIPAVNFGPGDPNMAHRVDERVDVRQITAATEMLRQYLVD
ncbi:succinyl-diaminopimelate desuccinylase [Mycobacterium yunnanensis]|uniref:Succinyl-diaminopimelate desuccinylase n=1 Tax=Mycobacterium yunnanensis TaxID=368477 RepID=A0A9X2YI42_9MYCO|nr:succinyl-diaminopimelate desuccinylase [Mycobacterium yunnanensis]